MSEILEKTPFNESDLRDLSSTIELIYGQDFSHYAKNLLRRRVTKTMEQCSINEFSVFLKLICDDVGTYKKLLNNLSIHVTSLYRDPEVFYYFRQKVIPRLKTYPYIRIWCAGGSSGEEAFSLAILLKEAGIYDRSLIYATDVSSNIIEKASNSAFPLSKMAEYTANYYQSGGINDFSEYYRVRSSMAYFDSSLKENIVFSTHNLATDSLFNEFQLILCRNVLIYFDDYLTNKALTLIHDSLVPFGTLSLGMSEGMAGYKIKNHFQVTNNKLKIFRRID